MNIFEKSKIVFLLENKVKSKEILSYQIDDNSIKIFFSKKNKIKIVLSNYEMSVLISILYRKLDINNFKTFLKINSRNIKLRKLL